MGIRPFRTRIWTPRPFNLGVIGVQGHLTMRKGQPALRSQQKRPVITPTKPSQAPLLMIMTSPLPRIRPRNHRKASDLSTPHRGCRAAADRLGIDGKQERRNNLAPFSFFTVVCVIPPMISLTIARNPDGTEKHTLKNVREDRRILLQRGDGAGMAGNGGFRQGLPVGGYSEFSETGLTPIPSVQNRRRRGSRRFRSISSASSSASLSLARTGILWSSAKWFTCMSIHLA